MLRETPTPDKLVQLPKTPQTTVVPCIADEILETQQDIHSVEKLTKSFKIYHCLEDGLYWIRICMQCLKDDEEGSIDAYFNSIGLDLKDLSETTHKVSHGMCVCCNDAIMKFLDEEDAKEDAIAAKASAVLNSKK